MPLRVISKVLTVGFGLVEAHDDGDDKLAVYSRKYMYWEKVETTTMMTMMMKMKRMKMPILNSLMPFLEIKKY